MNKIVREHYPASKLPEDLRGDLPEDATVRVTLEADIKPVQSIAEIWAEVEAARKAGHWPVTTMEEGVARIRALRDEWDD